MGGNSFAVFYNNIFTLLLLGACIALPLYIVFFYSWNVDKMGDAEFANKFGTLYGGLNLSEKESKRKTGLFFPFFFVFRRMLFVLTAIFLKNFLWG